MYCSECGKEIKETVSFCPFCGAAARAAGGAAAGGTTFAGSVAGAAATSGFTVVGGAAGAAATSGATVVGGAAGAAKAGVGATLASKIVIGVVVAAVAAAGGLIVPRLIRTPASEDLPSAVTKTVDAERDEQQPPVDETLTPDTSGASSPFPEKPVDAIDQTITAIDSPLITFEQIETIAKEAAVEIKSYYASSEAGYNYHGISANDEISKTEQYFTFWFYYFDHPNAAHFADDLYIYIGEKTGDVYYLTYPYTDYLYLANPPTAHSGNNDIAPGAAAKPQPAKLPENILADMSKSERTALHTFFSNFSEACLSEFSIDSYSVNELVDFALQHNYINYRSRFSNAGNGFLSIPGAYVEQAIYRYFGISSINHTEYTNNWHYYLNGSYYLNEGSGEPSYWSQVTYFYENGDGTYTAHLDVYMSHAPPQNCYEDISDWRLEPGAYVIGKGDSRDDSSEVWGVCVYSSSYVAVVAPHEYNSRQTYKLLHLSHDKT